MLLTWIVKNAVRREDRLLLPQQAPQCASGSALPHQRGIFVHGPTSMNQKDACTNSPVHRGKHILIQTVCKFDP